MTATLKVTAPEHLWGCYEPDVNTLKAAPGGSVNTAPAQPTRDRFRPVARFRDRVAIVTGAGAPGDSSHPGRPRARSTRCRQSTYTAAKAGLVGLSRALALEIVGDSTTVNVVAPGYISTDSRGGTDRAQWHAGEDRRANPGSTR
jgi:NAD(P)-dependent dehydrogenase (short-subunit alcohol dehydrogenase family)